MLKFIILCVFLIFIVQCLESIPKADEVRKIVQEKQDAIELEHQRMSAEADEHNCRYRENILKEKEERAEAREIVKQTIEQSTLAFCSEHHNEVLSVVSQMVEIVKEGDEMKVFFWEMRHDTAFCVMKELMEISYCVKYIPLNKQLVIDLNSAADQSRIEMRYDELCGPTITYAIYCAEEKENCMMFQHQFDQCMNDQYNCFDPREYLGMKEIHRQQSNFVCV